MDVGEAPEGKLDVGPWTLNAWKRLRKMHVNLSSRKEESQVNLLPVGNASRCPRLAKNTQRGYHNFHYTWGSARRRNLLL